MAKPLHSVRRTPRFSTSMARPPFLPPRCFPPHTTLAKPGFATYYLSCDVRAFKLYLPHAVKHHQRGFRAALLAPVGLVFEPPSVGLLGLQDGDTFEHAMGWVTSNPIDEIHVEASAQKQPVTLKEQEKAQQRFADAISSIEGVEQARRDAEAELDAATAALIALQGVESVWIDGIYYDPTYSREKVYLKKRDPRFNPAEAVEPEEAVEPPKKARKRVGKRSKRAA